MKTIETINKNLKKDCDTLQKNLVIQLIEKFEVGKEITVRLSTNSIEVALLNKDKKNIRTFAFLLLVIERL